MSDLNRSGGWPTHSNPVSNAQYPVGRAETLEITGGGPRGVRVDGLAGVSLTDSQATCITDAEYFMLRERAMRDSAAERWVHALDAFRLAVILGPTDASNWAGLARAYAELGDSIAAGKAQTCAEIMREHALRQR